MVLPSGGYVPRQRLHLESKIVARRTPVQIGELTAWETASKGSNGATAQIFMAPELNFFPVRIVDGDSTHEYFDIVVGEPDPQLFELSAGAQIGRTGPPLRLGRFSRQELAAGGQAPHPPGPR